MHDYDFLVFIGRFQPFHNGHLSVINEALAAARHAIVVCGSVRRPRSVRNPFNFSEREAMIRGALGEEQNARVTVLPVMDQRYNEEAWLRRVQTSVAGVVGARHRTPNSEPRIGLIGHGMDRSSYYPSLFPQWGCLDVPNYLHLSSTEIRRSLFDPKLGPVTERLAALDRQPGALPDNVKADLRRFVAGDGFAAVQEEYDFAADYQAQWSAAPYPPVFVTVDAVVVQSGHVLLVERRAMPGRGQWALPGGFVDRDEWIEDACSRELREETRLEVPDAVLRGSIKRRGVYDEPYRSVRGRTITHAFLIELQAARRLPPVEGGDDAGKAFWQPLADVIPERMFEDHCCIIQDLIGA